MIADIATPATIASGIDLSTSAFVWGQIRANFTIPEGSFAGYTCLITGGNAGLGLEAAIHLAKRNASRIILAVRNLTKGETAVEVIRKRCPDFSGKLEVMKLDMSDLESIKSFTSEIEKLERLDVAILNAGLAKTAYTKNANGWEETLWVNGIATGLLASMLLPTLVRTSRLHNDLVKRRPHMLIVASEIHYWSQLPKDAPKSGILKAVNAEKGYDSIKSYSFSKLLDVFIARELAKVPAAKDVVINSANPGLCASDFMSEAPAIVKWLMGTIAWTTEFGSQSYITAVLQDTQPGAYVSYGKEFPTSKFVMSKEGQETQAALWAELLAVYRGLIPDIETRLQSSS